MFENKQDGSDKTKPREPNHIFRIIAAAYILYLAYKIFAGLREENFQNKYAVLLIIGAVLFVAFGIYFIVISLKALMAKSKQEVEDYERIKAEEAKQTAMQPAIDDDDDEETGVYYTVPDDIENDIASEPGAPSSSAPESAPVPEFDASVDNPGHKNAEDE